MTIPDTRPAPGRHRAPDAAPSPAPWIPQQGPRSPHSGGWPIPVPSGPFAAPLAGGHPRSATSGPVMAPTRVAPPAPRYGHPMPPAPMPPAPTSPTEDDPPTHAFPTPGPLSGAPMPDGPTPGGPTPGGPTPGGPTPGGPTPGGSQDRPKRKKWPWAVGAVAVLVVGATIGQSGATTPPAPAAGTPATAATDDGSSSGTSAFGRPVESGDVTVTAQKPVKRSQEFIGTQYCSSVTLRNTGSSTEAFSPFDWKFRTSAGVETTAGVPFNADKALTSGTLRPGGTVSGEVCADTETTGVTDVVYSPGFGILHEVTFAP